jgi:hypothetical protein
MPVSLGLQLHESIVQSEEGGHWTDIVGVAGSSELPMTSADICCDIRADRQTRMVKFVTHLVALHGETTLGHAHRTQIGMGCKFSVQDPECFTDLTVFSRPLVNCLWYVLCVCCQTSIYCWKVLFLFQLKLPQLPSLHRFKKWACIDTWYGLHWSLLLVSVFMKTWLFT